MSTLVLAVGNLSRGDDAVGPWIAARVAEVLADRVAAGELEVIVEAQLQVEHALDLQGRDRVVFVDASVAAPAPFGWDPTKAADVAPVFSHALSPGQVLATCVRLFGASPPAWTLAVHAERFELGEDPSAEARRAAEAALTRLLRVLG